MTVEGTWDPRFASLIETFEAQLSSGEELGAAIAVNFDGETLVDIWGGHRDAARTAPWQQDTIVNVWSTTKEISALAVLMCVDRGLLDVHAPVGEYWPEFAQNGKDAVLVRHLLSHTSGVSGWDQPFVREDMYDLPTATARLAEQEPWWEPGTASGYHANSQGHLLGELVRRVTGRSLTRFVAEEIAAPLGVDLQIGAPPADEPRIAEIVPPPPISLEGANPESVAVKTFTGPAGDAAAANTRDWRNAELGALNGHTNARALARTFSVIARGGEVDGVRLLSPETIGLIFEEQSNGVDLVLGIPLRWGIGFALHSPQAVPYLPDAGLCFWGGWGGSLTAMSTDHKLTISYVMNRMGTGIIGSERTAAYIPEILRSLDIS